MGDHVSFWFAKFVADFLFALIAMAVLLAVPLYLLLRQSIREWRCKHETFWENRSCDAICNKCGKNLGFIATVREARKNKPEPWTQRDL